MRWSVQAVHRARVVVVAFAAAVAAVVESSAVVAPEHPLVHNGLLKPRRFLPA